MKPSEWFQANITNDHPDEQSREMERKILALLEAVEGDGTATTSARHPVVIDAWAACVLEFALAYRAGRDK